MEQFVCPSFTLVTKIKIPLNKNKLIGKSVPIQLALHTCPLPGNLTKAGDSIYTATVVTSGEPDKSSGERRLTHCNYS